MWGLCTVESTVLTQSVQKLQNCAARIICKNFDFVNVRGIDLVNELGWQTIETRRNFHIATLMFKCIHGLAPDYLCDQVTLVSEIATRSTRSAHSLDVVIPKVNKEIFRKSFQYSGAVVSNNLPDNVRRADDLFTFKLQYRQCYF